MLFSVEPAATGKADVRLAWEKLQITFPVEVDVHAIMAARITEAIAKTPEDWRVYYQAASYHLDNELDLIQAREWAGKSVEIQQSSWNLDLLARLLHATGDTAEAIPALTRAIEMARERKAPAESIAALEKRLAEWKAASH